MSRQRAFRAASCLAALVAIIAPGCARAQQDSSHTAAAVAEPDSSRATPHYHGFLLDIPRTLGSSARYATRRPQIKDWLIVGATTGVLYAFDRQIYTNARHAGDAIGVSRDHPQAALMVGSTKLFYVPTTVGSGLYYLGDGWTTMFVAGTYLTVGAIKHDSRATLTASEITESLLALGVVTQTIKHATGRQTPGTATSERGEWHPFENWREYSNNTPKYDAMPSGHLATAISTVTVIAANYPDNPWVKPIGYGLSGVLAFAMVNNGVHWARDYPLAIAIGKTVGEFAAQRGRGQIGRIEPVVGPSDIGLRVRF